jgi:hypothetical protein
MKKPDGRRDAHHIDVNAVAARVADWLADGKDVRLVAVPRAIPEFPLIEMWNGPDVEVLTNAGAFREDPPAAPVSPRTRQRAVPGRPLTAMVARAVPLHVDDRAPKRKRRS